MIWELSRKEQVALIVSNDHEVLAGDRGVRNHPVALLRGADGHTPSRELVFLAGLGARYVDQLTTLQLDL